MKKSLFIFLMTMGLLAAYSVFAHSQPGYGYGMGGMGRGMMGGYGMGMSAWIDVPDKLPPPKNSQWVEKLQEILVMEKDSLAQYEADQEKFNAHMPYIMVIPQEEQHVQWIKQMFAAYGLPANEKTNPIVQTKTLTEAYELSIKMEKDLLPRYEWLIKNAEDPRSAEMLDNILIQSRYHITMFEHALQMGHGYSFGMRKGFVARYVLWPGMMGEYGYHYGYRGIIMWIIFLIVLVVAIYFIVRMLRSKNVTSRAQDTPLDILKKRYCTGEITKEEFDQMKKDLQ